MADEIKLHKQRARGAEAKRLLDNSMYKETFEVVEKEIMNAWRDSNGPEKEQREEAYRLLRTLQRLKGVMTSYMYTGEIAAKDLFDLEQDKEMKR